MRLARHRVAVFVVATVGALILVAGVSAAGHREPHGAGARVLRASTVATADSSTPADSSSGLNSSGGGDDDLIDEQAQYGYERSAPAASVSGAAVVAAAQQAAALPAIGGPWQEFTNKSYNAEPSNYTDPFWGNAGAGFSLVGGRVTALVTAPDGAWFAGTADGGVWRSRNQGTSWTPVFDSMPSLSVGALAVDPVDGSLWVGTGEANVSADSYAGTGVYRSTNDGASWTVVAPDSSGNSPMVGDTTFRIAFDQSGDAYAATDNGLFRLAAGASQWQEVLDPAGSTDFPPYDQQVTDVSVVPGSLGMDVIAAIGWHGPGNTQNNGFYQSTDGGMTFSQVTPTGLDATTGRTTFAYSADGSKLYAIVAQGATGLQGIFVSTGSGGNPASVAGPWTLIASASTLASSGSASPTFGTPGQQAWYNQDLAVDPTNPNHVYAGLEEVYESTNGGSSWITASPYWNYNFACDYTSPATCPNTTHPDQHAMMITDGKIVIGNDGGVYSRPLSDTAADGNWSDLNATLGDLQYYDARAGQLGAGATAVWGGLQDNGSSFLASNSSQMVEPAGGDGFYVIVDPSNANDIAGEYTDGTVYSSTDGGHSFSDFISPTCAAQEITALPGGPRSDCDPSARFATPLVQDQQNPEVWLIGGEDVWLSTAGWGTSCTNTSCSWQAVYDTGAGHAVTALSSANGGQIIYAAWVANGNPGSSFASGIATNYGGTWHQVNTTGLPNRYIAGVTVDPSNPAHAYAIFNGYSRRFIPGGGVGHVFETWNGGASWTDISGNLPDVASDALVIEDHHLALGTDVGMFTATEGHGSTTKWFRLGKGLPNASVNDVTLGPGGYVYAATHGRGVWRLQFPLQ